MFFSKHLLPLVFLTAFCISVNAQKTGKIDSLQTRLATVGEDTNKVTLMLAISDQFNALDPNEGLKWGGNSTKTFR